VAVGVSIMRAAKEKLLAIKEKQPERVEIRLNFPVVGLVTWNDYVTGVRYKTEDGRINELNGKAVVLTTGGFSADRDNETSLLTEFASQLLPLPTTNGKWATGDGVKMARAMGAAIVGMNRVQVHPTAFIDPANPSSQTKFLAAEALRGKGALLLNNKGRRFGNELGRRDSLTAQIQKHCAASATVGNLPVAFMLMNPKSAEGFGLPSFSFYHKIKGFFKEVRGVDELAAYIGCGSDDVKSTLDEYNTLASKYLSGERNLKDAFGKKVFPVEFDTSKDSVFYVAQITPAIHYTMGGLKIDRDAVVFSEFTQRPFKGLLAAGESTGGVHGSNRLAGNSLLECVVFGRIAGRSAVSIDWEQETGEQFRQGTTVKSDASSREEL